MTDTSRISPTYAEVFRAHRIRFLIPVVLAALIAGWAGASAPKMYRSGATLWSDSATSTSALFGALPPAGQDQQLLNELLTTRYFEESIARTSSLESYLRTHPSDGSGAAALIGKLKGPKSLDDRLAAALGPKRVTSNAKGPHVLEVNYDAPSPQLAVSTLRAIVVQFRQQRTALRADALTAAQKQVSSASTTLAEARMKVTSYLDQHPSSRRSDAELQALAVSEREAVTALSNATDTMSQATQAVANGESSQTVLRVIDPPQLPTGPTAGKKKLVETCVAGLFAGAAVSGIGVVMLARRKRRQPTVPAQTNGQPLNGTPPQLLVEPALEPVE
jgi:uncharacterized protein involved in exopolysaccharide biosynthesis